MLNEDQYLDRTPDLVARVRKMREAAQKQMDRFTCVADYDVRRVVGHGPKPVPVSAEAGERTKKAAPKSISAQSAPESAPEPAESGDVENV